LGDACVLVQAKSVTGLAPDARTSQIVTLTPADRDAEAFRQGEADARG